MYCQCCESDMIHIGTTWVTPEPGGLFGVHEINQFTGKWRHMEGLAPVEVLDTLRKWGINEEMIQSVEEDLKTLGQGGS